jgi:hypothetical protein
VSDISIGLINPMIIEKPEMDGIWATSDVIERASQIGHPGIGLSKQTIITPKES